VQAPPAPAPAPPPPRSALESPEVVAALEKAHAATAAVKERLSKQLSRAWTMVGCVCGLCGRTASGSTGGTTIQRPRCDHFCRVDRVF
jgi:hypothetical protein